MHVLMWSSTWRDIWQRDLPLWPTAHSVKQITLLQCRLVLKHFLKFRTILILKIITALYAPCRKVMLQSRTVHHRITASLKCSNNPDSAYFTMNWKPSSSKQYSLASLYYSLSRLKSTGKKATFHVLPIYGILTPLREIFNNYLTLWFLYL